MNTNTITRQIGIGMLAFCATFVQTTMFAASQFGAHTNAQAVQASDTQLAADGRAVSTDANGRG